MATRITSKMVTCPYCLARPGRSCKGERIPSANTFGGGWGGPPPRKNSHPERIAAAKKLQAKAEFDAAYAMMMAAIDAKLNAQDGCER